MRRGSQLLWSADINSGWVEEESAMAAKECAIEGAIFPRGQKIESDHFTGAAWLERLGSNEGIFNCLIGNVTFEPGARNSWHKHPGGQILLATGGVGCYQQKGQPIQMLRAGDVVGILPNVEHWHGASSDSWFSHLAVSTNLEKGGVEWLEPVTAEEYGNLPT
jgi:quercetin dioxygenase-like cupin family protein